MNLYLLKRMVVEIPLIQVGIFIALCSFVALWGKLKLILPIIYCSVLYWVFFLNEYKFAAGKEGQVLHTGLFILCSIIFVGISAWVLFIER